MKKVLVFLGILGIMVPQGLFAQMENPEDKVTIIDSPASNVFTAEEKMSLSSFGFTEDMGVVMCGESHPYDSVKTAFQSNLESTVPGANISFEGMLRNEDEAPLIGSKLVLRILKKNDKSTTTGEGYDIVDQFTYDDKLNIGSWEEKKVSVNWHVPEDVAGGEYFLVPFVIVDEHIVSGFYFMDTAPIDAPQFRVKGTEAQGVFFDKTKTTINEQQYSFSGLVTRAPKNEATTVRVVLTNPRSEEQVMRVTWNEYLRNDFRDENLQNKKLELIALGANESKEISYEVSPKYTTATYLSVVAEGQYQKNIQNIRFIREGLTDVAIETASLKSFTLREGVENSLSGCVSVASTVADNQANLMLTLKDQRGNIIHTYQSDKPLVRGVNEFTDTFTPTKNYGEVILTATLTDASGQIMEFSTPYSCMTLSGGACYDTDQPLVVRSWKNIALILILMLPIVVLAVLIIKKQKSKNRFKFFLALFIVGATLMLPLHKADAAKIEVDWKFSGPKANQSSISQNSNCSPGWTFTNLLDDNANSKHLLGEADTNSGMTQLCIRADDPTITLSSQWTTTGCSGGNTLTGVWDDAGTANPWDDDSYHVHSLNEENFRPNNSRAYSWCLGASGGGATKVQSRWVEWVSSTYYPPCATDETILIGTHRKNEWFRFLNMNYEDTDGANQRSLCAKIVVVNNNPPTTPSLTGPTTGNTATPYPYVTQASDPDGNTVRYGIDWDNNKTIDEWTAYAASNTAVSTNHAWATPGSYTFEALAQDSNGASSGWSTPLTMTIATSVSGLCGLANGTPTTPPPTIGLCTTGAPSVVTPSAVPGPYAWTCTGSGGGGNATCNAPYLTPAPTLDLKINGSDIPITVNRNDNLSITWTPPTNATTCTGSGNNWNGVKSILGGSDNILATAPSLYTLTCTGPGGTTSDSVSVTLSKTFKICQNACNQGDVPNPLGMVQGSTRQLTGCFNDATSCTDASGDVTGTTTWTDTGGPEVSISNGLITANQEGSENVTGTYSSSTQTRRVDVSCLAQSCSTSEALKYCTNETFSWPTGCAVTPTQTCSGSKSCDFNWKEVAPN
jgi:hypothetical protein